jgi:hypothetical protein
MLDQNLHQRVRACKALLALMGYEHLWTEDGPTAEAKKLVDQYGGPMSNPQWTLYQFIWFVWGRPSDVKVQELMQLPNPQGELAAALLHALKSGSDAVEAWLERAEGAAQSPQTKRWNRQLN